ncbi:MAG TPA: glutamate ABC transporter substrate-binding protein [Catenuloplanes sp.]|jgi:polar amino acid transport system substrate-binding protein
MSTAQPSHPRTRRTRAARALLAPVLLTAVAVLAAGCTGTPPPRRGDATASAPAAPGPAAPGPAAAPEDCNARQSLRPAGPLPKPNSMPAGSYMDEIRKRGLLRVGTSQDTLLFSSRNPITGRIEGFDVDMARAVAKAIFDDENKIQIIVTPNAQRIPAAKDGTVDLVVQTTTMNCTRWKEIDFSTVYYDAGQKVLVSTASTAKGVGDLGGKRVCAAAGSTSLENLERLDPRPITVAMPGNSDCLVAFQRNQVDAISTDDTILAGLAAQDPYAKVIGAPFTKEPYGIAISKEHEDFTRFVNAVLERQRADGSWKRTYEKWLGRFGATPNPPAAEYRG